jgi:hypothetical protein
LRNDERINRALQEIASEGTDGHSDLWKGIKSSLANSNAFPVDRKLRLSSRWIAVIVLLIFSTAFVFIIFTDPGLKSAEDAGLVKHLEQTAIPTVFSQVPTQLASSGIVSQTRNGITVTLNWAYADELRVAWQLTITGLALPQGSDPGDFICDPYLTTKQGIPLKVQAILDNKVFEDQPGTPRVITYVVYQKIDTKKNDHLDIDLDLTVGPCANWMNFNEAYIGPGPTPTQVPLIGNYHLTFTIPVNAGQRNSIDQSVIAGGIAMNLKEITFTPSYTLAQLCYPVPQVPGLAGDLSWMRTGGDWTPDKLTLSTAKSGVETDSNYFKIIKEPNDGSGEICADVGFPVSADSPSTKLTLKVSNLTNYESITSLLEDRAAQKIVAERLKARGIEVKFDPQGNNFWVVLTKPAEMSDDEANQVIQKQLKHTVEALWKFEIPVKQK